MGPSPVSKTQVVRQEGPLGLTWMDLDLRGGQNGRRGLAEVIRRNTETEAKIWRPTALSMDPGVPWPSRGWPSGKGVL